MDTLPAVAVMHLAAPTAFQTVFFWACRIFGFVWFVLSFSLFYRILTVDYTAKKELPVLFHVPFPYFVIMSMAGLAFLTVFVLLYGRFGPRGIAAYSFLFVMLTCWWIRVGRMGQNSADRALVCSTRKDWRVALFSSTIITAMSFHFFAYSAFRLAIDALSLS